MTGLRSPSAAQRGSGSQQALRVANRSRLLDALRELGPSTQAGLSRSTGLSAATVSNLVRLLVDEQAVETETTTSGGRRAVLVQLRPGGGTRVAAGVDIGRTHLRVVLAAPGLQVLAERERELPAGHRPTETIRAAAAILEALLAETGVQRSAVVGCGVGIPGPIAADTGEISQPVLLPEWVGLRLASYLEDALGLPVYVENDANLGALAEVSWGAQRDVEDLVFVKVGTGIGAGLILGGRLHRGHRGMGGEIGHTTLSDYGPVCRCGRRGCVEAVASTSTMLALMRAGQPGRALGLNDLVSSALAGDPAVVRIIEDAGLALGQVMGQVANLLSPQVVVLGGPLAPVGQLLVDSVRQGLQRYASPVVGAGTDVVVSSLGPQAEALGACTLVLRNAPEHAWT